jgi:hypothetical protein
MPSLVLQKKSTEDCPCRLCDDVVATAIKWFLLVTASASSPRKQTASCIAGARTLTLDSAHEKSLTLTCVLSRGYPEWRLNGDVLPSRLQAYLREHHHCPTEAQATANPSPRPSPHASPKPAAHPSPAHHPSPSPLPHPAPMPTAHPSPAHHPPPAHHPSPSPDAARLPPPSYAPPSLF